MINNFAFIIEKDFFKYAFLLKEIEDDTPKFQNLISKFAIDKKKYPLNYLLKNMKKCNNK